jgi:hypothetical protein
MSLEAKLFWFRIATVFLLLALVLMLPVEAKPRKHKADNSCVRIESTGPVAWGISPEHAEERARAKAIDAWKSDVFKQRGAESMNMRGGEFNCSQAGPTNARRWTCRVAALACRT